MVADQVLALELSSATLEYAARLNALVASARQRCGDAEFQRLRRAVGLVMGEMLTAVVVPLYAQHPELKPPGLEL